MCLCMCSSVEMLFEYIILLWPITTKTYTVKSFKQLKLQTVLQCSKVSRREKHFSADFTDLWTAIKAAHHTLPDYFQLHSLSAGFNCLQVEKIKVGCIAVCSSVKSERHLSLSSGYFTCLQRWNIVYSSNCRELFTVWSFSCLKLFLSETVPVWNFSPPATFAYLQFSIVYTILYFYDQADLYLEEDN